MHEPMFVRTLTPEERRELAAGLRGRDGFRLRRCQVLLASSRGEHAPAVARAVGCSPPTARAAIAAFNGRGLSSLARGSTRPKSGPGAAPVFDDGRRERLREMLHQSPRTFGKPTSLWTLALAAAVAQERGLTAERVSDETIRQALKRLGVGWKRAKRWITSPDPLYALKKSGGTG
jgi:transposase